MNMNKALFQDKVRRIIDLGYKSELRTDCNLLGIRYVNKFNEVVWETVCDASSYDVLNRQEKKYLAWMNEVVV